MKTTPSNIVFSETKVNDGYLPAYVKGNGNEVPISSRSLESNDAPLETAFYTIVYSSNTVVLTIYDILKYLGKRKFFFNKQTICYKRDSNHLKIKQEILDKIDEGLTLKDLTTFYQL